MNENNVGKAEWCKLCRAAKQSTKELLEEGNQTSKQTEYVEK